MAAKQQVTDQRNSLEAAKAQLMENTPGYEEMLAQIEAGLTEVAGAEAELNAKNAELEAAAGQLSSAESQLAAAKQQIEDGKNALAAAEAELTDGENQLAAAKEQTEAELTEWENAKDPQPERSEAVRKNRQRLDALKIPYQEFYKAIEFGDSLTEQECNHLEEALLSMGILDALVVDASYREQVLTMEEGCEDRYLFVQKSYSGKSLLDVLELNDSMNDIFSNQRLTGILSGIAYNEESMISVSSEGIYQMGVLSGTITGEHVAGFLGARARERNRQEQIRVCKEKIQGLQSSKNQLEAKKAGIVIRMQKLEQEYQALPQDTGIRTAFKMLVQEQHKYETKTAECKEIEERWKKLSEQIQEKKKKAIEIAQQLYLQCTYAIFQEAKDAAAEYEKNLIALKSAHEMFLQSVRHMKDLTRRLESIDADLDEIRYDLSGAQRHLVKLEQEHASIVEQLKLTDYEQIRERLDACITWLKEYPEHLNQCLQKRAGIKEHLDTLRKQEEAGESQKQILEQKRIWRGKCYEAEFALAVLSKWNRIFCKDNEMYIVENPSVFAGLCAGHTKQVSCMCMNGQPRLAGLVTLDLLAASGTVVYYAGDLDPEGLLIAQKISEYYAGEFHYWHMTVEDYEKSKSNETISEKRIKSLERITDTELFPVAEKMRLDRLAGYQEKIEIK